jgi:hypothetical protein
MTAIKLLLSIIEGSVNIEIYRQIADSLDVVEKALYQVLGIKKQALSLLATHSELKSSILQI